MKLILVIALVALAFPWEGECLRCYHCKSPDSLPSSIIKFNSLPLCANDIKESPTETHNGVEFADCVKILEKVKVGDKEETLTIRAVISSSDNINLNSSNLDVTKCKEDLCNSASVARDVAIGVVVTVAMAFALSV